MKSMSKFLGASVLAVSLSACFGGEQSADLGQVLDRTKLAMERYQDLMKQQNVNTADEKQLNQFTGFMRQVMNAEPKFYDQPVGVDLLKDAKFSGYADKNANAVQDPGEEQIFTVEIDSENNRLIASDSDGTGTSLGFSGTGFIAGALIGSLLARQSAAGIRPGSFNNRQVTPRSRYAAPASSRSSSARSSARSGGLSGGK